MGMRRKELEDWKTNINGSRVLCVYVIALISVFLGLLTVESGVSLSLSPVLETCFLLLGCLVHLDMRPSALLYCILLCPFWMSFLGGLLFSQGKWRGVEDLGEGWGTGELGRMKGEEPVVVIYERRINKKEIKKMKLYFVWGTLKFQQVENGHH